jgi:hypothetical protein
LACDCQSERVSETSAVNALAMQQRGQFPARHTNATALRALHHNA